MTRSYQHRDRAESFGSVAEAYDRYRPGYPAALFDDLTSPRPTNALDVGTGTGKAARALLDRGVPVLGVEIDPRMAEVARGHGLEVEVGSFETWDAQGRTFDLLTCAQAWHWIDPVAGAAKAADLVRPGGVVARFWNYRTLDDHTHDALLRAYRTCAPELSRSNALNRSGIGPLDDDPFDSSVQFSSVTERTYEWEESLSADEWIGNIGTHSDHTALPADQRERLLRAVRAAIATLGGTVAARSATYLLSCSRI